MHRSQLYLPRHMPDPRDPGLPRGQEVEMLSPRGATDGEVILPVGDDGAVRDCAITTLEDLGYRVLAAADGPAALALFDQADRVDILFTDMVLGGALTGRQVADQIWARHPALPILFTTGYTRNAIFHHGRLDPGVNLLNKPYTPRDLATKIRAILDGA